MKSKIARYLIGWLAMVLGFAIAGTLIADPPRLILHSIYWSTAGYAIAIWMHCGEER